VEQLQPSWAAIRGYPFGTEDSRWHGMGYFNLAQRFDPPAWNPAEWAAQVKAAGFRYVVLTAKHHDGFALWPSRWGNFSTRQFCGGKDFLIPYVNALRAAGLKVGFYFSPRDWHYPGFPLNDVDFDHTQRRENMPVADSGQDSHNAKEFFTFTIAQLHELLTQYGAIDELWFDGLDWPRQGFPTRAVYRWIRSLQPQIVINDRWEHVRNPDGKDTAHAGLGDFTSHEWTRLQTRPEGWWEFCRGWYGHWGYSGLFAGSVEKELEELGRIRSWGGNYLLNLGPQPNGHLPEGTEVALSKMADWMVINGEAIHDTSAGPDVAANVPVTIKEDTWYLHLFSDWSEPVKVRCEGEVRSVRLLGENKEVTFKLEHSHLLIPAVGTGYRILKIDWCSVD
jgi:alpha-L-fucosidase